MCFIDADTPRFIYSVARKARKDHTCCECGEMILKNTSYEYTAGRWDDFNNFKTCHRCVRVRERLAVFERTAGCRPSESFVPYRCLHQTLVDHDLTFESVFAPDAEEKYLNANA